jgi:hypothetical protein
MYSRQLSPSIEGQMIFEFSVVLSPARRAEMREEDAQKGGPPNVTDNPGRLWLTVAAAICSLVGPAVAGLSQTGHLMILEDAPFGVFGALAGIVTFDLVIGVLAIFRGAKIAGIICVLTNAAVVAFYGLLFWLFEHGGIG